MVRQVLIKLWQDERGQSSVVTFPLVALLLVLILGVAAFVVKVRPAQVAVGSAARACARNAVVTLSEPRGLEQSHLTALDVLQARHLNPDQAEVRVTPLGAWERFSAVQCEVVYRVDLRKVPLLALFAPDPDLELTTSYTLDVDPFKSRWEE
jgi:hypothetical protein